MSHKPRSSRITALAVAIAIGASGTAIVPMATAQESTGHVTESQLDNGQDVQENPIIDLDDYIPEDMRYGGDNQSVENVHMVTVENPGESIQLKTSVPVGKIQEYQFMMGHRKIEDLQVNESHRTALNDPDDQPFHHYDIISDEKFQDFLNWFDKLISFDDETGIITFNTPEEFWEIGSYGTLTGAKISLSDIREDVRENGNAPTADYIPSLLVSSSDIDEGPEEGDLAYGDIVTFDVTGVMNKHFPFIKEEREVRQGETTTFDTMFLIIPDLVYFPEWSSIMSSGEPNGSEPIPTDITLQPGYDIKPGTYPFVVGTSEASQGDSAYASFITPNAITVTPANLYQDYDPSYPTQTIHHGDDKNVTVPVSYGGDAPEGAETPTYSIDEGFTAPDNWSIDIDETTGEISVSAPDDGRGGDVTVPVTVSYPDGTEDSTSLSVELVASDAYTTGASWENEVTVVPGEQLTIEYTGDNDIPSNATVRVGDLPSGWTTGRGSGGDIIVTAPGNAEHESTETLTISVTYADGSGDSEDVEITVSNPSDAQVYDLSYNTDDPVRQQSSRDYAPGFGDDNPEVGSYEINTESEWLDFNTETGVITASPGADIDPGTEANATVTVTYADGSEDTTEVTITVGDPSTTVNTDITYPQETVRVNQSAEIAPEFSPEDFEGNVSYRPETQLPGWIELDEDTGVITASPDDNVQVRDHDFTIIATYEDGSKDTSTVTITVDEKFLNERIEISYRQDQNAPRGDTTTSDPRLSPELPEGTVFSLTPHDQQNGIDPAQSVEDIFSIDESTGVVEITPSATVPAENGPQSTTVYVTYPDESEDEIDVVFNVTAMSDGDNPVTYESLPVNQGSTETFTPTTEGGDYTYSLAPNAPDWAEIDEDTGVVTVSPGYRVTARDWSFDVEFIYPDGSEGLTTIDMTVNSVDQNIWLDPNYAPIQVVAGQVAESDRPNFGPNGQPIGNVRYEIEDTDWARIDSQGVVTVEPGVDLEGQTETLTVTITYSDGSEDTTEIQVEVQERDDNNVYEPFYDNVVVAQDKSASVEIDYRDDTPDSALYAKGAGFPDWAELAEDGTITVSPGFGNSVVGTQQVPVQIKYEDGTTDNVNASVTINRGADSDNYDLHYLNGNVKQSERLTLDPIIRNYDGVGTELDDATYRKVSGPEWMAVNVNTGVVSARPAVDTPIDSYDFEIEIIYGDGTRETTTSTIQVGGTSDAVRYQLTYGDGANVEQGDTATGDSPVRTVGEPMPEGTTLSPVNAPDWVEINEDGSYSVSPGYDIGAGNYPVTVTVVYADGSTEDILLPITVTQAEIAKEFDNPSYQSVEVTQGQSVSSSAPVQGTRALPEGTSYSLQYGAPNWVGIDSATGVVTVEPGFRVTPDNYDIPVNIAYPDGSRASTSLSVNVNIGRFADGYSPSYSSGIDAPQGSQVTIPAPRDQDGQRLPTGTKYSAHSDNPEWVAVGVDGTVTASPGYDIDPGSYQAMTVVTYEDGTVDEVPVAIRVLPEDDPADAPVTSTPQGFTDYSEEYIPSWQRSDGGTSVSADGLPDGYDVNEDGQVVDADGNVVAGASISDDGTVSLPGDGEDEEDGPFVNTGGSVSSSGFWSWVRSWFS